MEVEGTTGASPESAAAAPAASSAPLDAAGLFGSSVPATGESTEAEAETVLATEAAAAAAEGLTAEELEEIEYEGKRAKVPKEFKDAFLRQQDYTRKTQEVAELKRTEEARYADYQRSAQLREATFAESARIFANNQRLEQFQQLDWDAITKADPVQAMTLERQMRNLQGENQALAQSIAQKQQQMAFGEQQATAKRIEEGRQQLAREIKGWSPELQQKLASTATKEYGFRSEELAQVSDPRAIRLLHDAYMYRELMAKQTAKPPVAPLPKPVSKVGGSGATNTKAYSDMSPEEYQAKRQERRNATRR